MGLNAEREIYLNLDNIFPKSGLTPFLTLSIQDKISQLNELSNTVMGIRLLNCELGKGGIGLMKFRFRNYQRRPRNPSPRKNPQIYCLL